MTRLALSLLGPFQATLDGKPVTGFESAKVRALLAYLAAEPGRAHTREAVAELLWPERCAGVALADLRHALANLRKAIGDATAQPPFLLVTQSTLQFNPASNATIDMADFIARLHSAGSPTPADCQAALALRRGSFLEGFTLPGSPEFEEWQLVVAEHINHLARQALACVVDDCVARGDYAQATVWMRQQLALEPWNEEAHQQLILQLAMSGQYAAALHAYDICCRTLAKELGVEPQPATQALVARIRRGEQTLSPATGHESPPPVAHLAEPHNVQLPPPAPAFFGRTAELDDVAAHLANPDCRLLTILGPGGMGKTLLAVEAARTQGAHFSDGVWFVDLAPVNSPDLLLGAIQRALALPLAGPDAASERLINHLQGRQTLLVLDNFEHLLEGAGQVPPLLHAAPGLKLLVTSRSRLHLQEEWLLPLGGLATPPCPLPATAPAAGYNDNAPAALADFPSMRLFLQRVHQLDARFQPTPADLEQIAEICRLLEGMPLAIELAASWVRSLALAEIAEAVRGRLDLFTTSLRDLPARHRSMHDVFDHSWRLLDGRERSLLRQFAVFRGGCTLDAAAAVAGATLPEIEDLIDKSWLRLDHRRFTLHELMRQYCAEKLAQEHQAETGESAEAVHRRHCVFFAGMTSAREQALNWQCEPMAIFSADFGNLEAAWRWATAHGDFAATRQMKNALYYFADMTGWYGAMLPYFERAADALRTRWQQTGAAAQRQDAAIVLVSVLHVQASLLQHLHRLPAVQACLADMQAILATVDQDAAWQEWNLHMQFAVTWLEIGCGEFAAAHASARKLLTYLETNNFPCYPWRAEVGTRFMQMHMHHAIGFTARLLGDYKTAWTHSEAAIKLNDQIGERRFKARNLLETAALLGLSGDYTQALAIAQSALALSQSFQDRIHAAHGELTIGQIQIDAGRCSEAGEHCQRSLATALETGEHPLHIRSLVALAHIERLAGDLAAARRRLEEAARACVQPGITHSNHLAAVSLEFGHVASAENDWPQARRFYAETAAAKGCSAA